MDGITVKVLIDGLVYTVRYLGLDLPPDESYAGQAAIQNGELVYGQEIQLVADKPDKDANGRLLRYVTQGIPLSTWICSSKGLPLLKQSSLLSPVRSSSSKPSNPPRKPRKAIGKLPRRLSRYSEPLLLEVNA